MAQFKIGDYVRVAMPEDGITFWDGRIVAAHPANDSNGKGWQYFQISSTDTKWWHTSTMKKLEDPETHILVLLEDENRRVHLMDAGMFSSSAPRVRCGLSAYRRDGSIVTTGSGVVTPRCRGCMKGV